MKRIGLYALPALICLSLCSCPGMTFSVSSPWGEASSDGEFVKIIPKPIVFPEK